jgi:hypothetical protein
MNLKQLEQIKQIIWPRRYHIFNKLVWLHKKDDMRVGKVCLHMHDLYVANLSWLYLLLNLCCIALLFTLLK